MDSPSDRLSQIRKIAFLGDYLPRKCGIATFTTDLLTAIATEHPQTQCFAVPVNDPAVAGVKVMLMLQLAPASTWPVQFVVSAKFDVAATESIVTGAVPLLVKVTV